MKKHIYGIDAPPVIKGLILSGIIIFLIGIFGYKFLINHYPYIAFALLVISLLGSAINLIFSILMVRSSLFGKIIMRDRIIDLLNLNGDENVLDVGCGRGLLLIGVAKQLTQHGKAFGIDLWRDEDLSCNQESFTRANAQSEGVADHVCLVSGDMTKMQFNDSQFDAIVSSMAIHNVPTSEGRSKAIQEITRTLRPGGRLIILDFQHTQEYLESLKHLGWKDVELTNRYFTMFPPVRLVIGTKSVTPIEAQG